MPLNKRERKAIRHDLRKQYLAGQKFKDKVNEIQCDCEGWFHRCDEYKQIFKENK